MRRQLFRTVPAAAATAIPLLLVPALAAAHPGHEGEGGAFHLLTSPEHFGLFWLAGAMTALLCAGRRAHRALLAVAALAAIAVAVPHLPYMAQGGPAFVAEFLLSAAMLFIGGYQLTRLARAWIAARGQSRR